MFELLAVIFVLAVPVAIVLLVIIKAMTPKKKDVGVPMKDVFIVIPKGKK